MSASVDRVRLDADVERCDLLVLGLHDEDLHLPLGQSELGDMSLHSLGRGHAADETAVVLAEVSQTVSPNWTASADRSGVIVGSLTSAGEEDVGVHALTGCEPSPAGLSVALLHDEIKLVSDL